MSELADKLTVVLLTYNCAHRLHEILRQLTGLGVPVIAVDNASSDATREVIADFGTVELIALDRNIGAAARNVGMQRAQTPYVAFCDDDGWFERRGLEIAVGALEASPRLALVNARIIVEPHGRLDPISAVMQASPLPERSGIPGMPIVGFMAGAVIVRVAAFAQVGGYRRRYFMGGEEETVALPLVRAGWQLRYRPDVVAHHRPSIANAPALRAHGLRNALWTCWLHRRLGSALRFTLLLLIDTPKNADWVRGVLMAARGLPWVLRCRSPVPSRLDEQLRMLDDQRFAGRAPLRTFGRAAGRVALMNRLTTVLHEYMLHKHGQRRDRQMAQSNPKNRKQYEALKDKGMSKERAAKIANTPDASSKGGKKSGSGSSPKQGGTSAQKKEAGRKGGKATASKSH